MFLICPGVLGCKLIFYMFENYLILQLLLNDSYNLITHTIYKTSGIENATTASILINTNTDEMIKISTVFKKNNEICIYEFFIIKEDTKYINLVDYGTLLIEPFNIDIETKTELYLSKPVEYNLNSIENTNTHNKDLINEFKLELVLIEEYKSNEEDEVYYESNKRFILNNDYYSNVKTSDTVLYNNNVVSSNIYISWQMKQNTSHNSTSITRDSVSWIIYEIKL